MNLKMLFGQSVEADLASVAVPPIEAVKARVARRRRARAGAGLAASLSVIAGAVVIIAANYSTRESPADSILAPSPPAGTSSPSVTTCDLESLRYRLSWSVSAASLRGDLKIWSPAQAPCLVNTTLEYVPVSKDGGPLASYAGYSYAQADVILGDGKGAHAQLTWGVPCRPRNFDGAIRIHMYGGHPAVMLGDAASLPVCTRTPSPAPASRSYITSVQIG